MSITHKFYIFYSVLSQKDIDIQLSRSSTPIKIYQKYGSYDVIEHFILPNGYKHGPYYSIKVPNSLKIYNGNYYKNKRVGFWILMDCLDRWINYPCTEWREWSQHEGYYNNDQKIGVWKNYNCKMVLVQRYHRKLVKKLISISEYTNTISVCES